MVNKFKKLNKKKRRIRVEQVTSEKKKILKSSGQTPTQTISGPWWNDPTKLSETGFSYH